MPLILRPIDLSPGMVLKDPIRKGSATLLPAGKALTEFDIDRLCKKWPQSLVYIVDAQVDGVAHLEEPIDHEANEQLQLRSIEAADFVSHCWRDGGFTPAQSAELQALVEKAFESLKRTPIHQASRKIGYSSRHYLTDHIARTFYYSLLLAERSRAWVVRQRKRDSSVSGLSDHVAGNLVPLGLGALLLDGGMSQIPNLEVSGPVSEAKQKLVMNHVDVSLAMLPPGVPSLVKTVVASHHENLDGSGYPKHLSKDRVHVFSRIVRIADSFDAGTSPRPWRQAKSLVQVLWEMSRYGERAGQYDSELVDMFMELMPPLPVGTLLQMQDGYFAAVVGQTRNPFKPKVVLLMDPKRERVSASEIDQAIDLSQPKSPQIRSLHDKPLDFLYSDLKVPDRTHAA